MSSTFMSIHGTQIIGLFYHFPFQVPLCFPNSHYPLCAFLSLRMFDYEDVTIGAWMLAMNVKHEDN
jgi:hypothetical protein